MVPILTRGLGPVARVVAVGFGPAVGAEEDTSVRKRIGGSRARRRFERLEREKRKQYEPGKAPYDAFTVGAVLLKVNGESVNENNKLIKMTKTVYDEQIDIKIIDVRNSSFNPFYKIFIECTGMKKESAR